MKLTKIFFWVFLSQIFCLGVFWLSQGQYYVVEPEEKLCWVFIPGNSSVPNWLMEWWEAVYLKDELWTPFLENINCESWNIANCCKEVGYRYAGVPIGQSYISDKRFGAEFLAAKKIIAKKSLNPHEYKLSEQITRKEVMKVILNISGKKIQEDCREIFVDVEDDWACKYIESALEYRYIIGNQAFRPNDPVTQTEALKMILQAKGVWKKYDTNNWQEDYISTAYYLGYIDKKYSDYNILATRGWIFSAAAKSYSDFSY